MLEGDGERSTTRGRIIAQITIAFDDGVLVVFVAPGKLRKSTLNQIATDLLE